MLKFNRRTAGAYTASNNGQAIDIVREGAAYWALYQDGKFLDSFKTLTEAKIEANTVAGKSALSTRGPGWTCIFEG
jgi:hypothetical protein